MTDLAVDTQHIPRRLRPGQVLGARYRLEGVAGSGGMATVWRAFDERLQRPVAIKFISDALAADPAAVARFAREARTHARIQHSNLVQVYDYSIAAAQPYLVMEYVDGSTLSERLDRGALSPTELQTLARELLSAIACVHDHGVLHRDIKCGNVLLDGDGHARLTDFGLARLEDASRITRTNEVVGTLRFLAPELIEGRPATRQSDLFALGVLLRTAVTQGEPHGQLPELIDWLTQHDPEARPPDAHVALDVLTERPSRAHPAPLRPRHSAEQQTARTLISEPTRRHASEARAIRSGPPRRWTEPLHLRPEPQRRRTAPQLRNRVVAVAALLLAIVGTAVTIATSGTGARPTGTTAAAGSHSTRATAHANPALLIDRQLQRLGSDIRRAAGP